MSVHCAGAVGCDREARDDRAGDATVADELDCTAAGEATGAATSIVLVASTGVVGGGEVSITALRLMFAAGAATVAGALMAAADGAGDQTGALRSGSRSKTGNSLSPRGLAAVAVLIGGVRSECGRHIILDVASQRRRSAKTTCRICARSSACTFHRRAGRRSSLYGKVYPCDLPSDRPRCTEALPACRHSGMILMQCAASFYSKRANVARRTAARTFRAAILSFRWTRRPSPPPSYSRGC